MHRYPVSGNCGTQPLRLATRPSTAQNELDVVVVRPQAEMIVVRRAVLLVAFVAFSLNLSSPVNATITTGTATGTLDNPYPEPSLSVAGASTTSPASGTSTLSFSVSLSAASQYSTSVNYATADGTAIAGTDYTAASGTLTIPAGQTSGTVSVTILAQGAYGPTKTFSLNLSSPVNATITTGTATGTILNPYPATPSPTSVAPPQIGQGASKAIVITGTNFAAGSTAVVSGTGVTLSKVTVVNSTTIDATAKVTATAATGARDVTVKDTAGSGVCSGCLTIDAHPTLTSASPPDVAVSAAGTVTFSGTNFESGAVTVKFTGPGTTVKASAVSVLNSTTVTAKVTVPAGSALGTYTVTVTNPDGGAATCSTCFSVIAAATLTSLSTPSVAPGSTTSETITGSGFVAGLKLKGPTGVTFTKIVVVNSTTITVSIKAAATAPAGTNLAVTVTDSAAGGYATATGDVLTIT